MASTVDQIRQELFNAFGARQVATIYTPSNDYQIHPESLPEFQADPSGLEKIFLKTNVNQTGRRSGHADRRGGAVGGGVGGVGALTGPVIPLAAVTRITPSVGPLQVNHQGQQPAVTISFNLNARLLARPGVDAIHQIERESNLPATIASGFQGTAQVFQESPERAGHPGAGGDLCRLRRARRAVRELFIHPITIISGLPSAGVGALLILMAFNMDLSVIAMIASSCWSAS